MTTTTNIGHAQNGGDTVVRSLQGTITNESGGPVAGAKIEVGAYTAGLGFRIVASAITDVNGYYTVPSYTRYLGDEVFVILTIQGNVIINTLQSETFNFQIPQQRATVTGKITYMDEYETPIAGYPLRLNVYLGNGGRIDIASTVTDSEGNYTFSFIAGQFNSVYGPNMFKLIFNDHFDQVFELLPGAHRTVNYQTADIRPPFLNGYLEGEIIDQWDVPVDNAVVSLVGTNTPIFQAGNYFSADVLRGGNHTLKVIAPGYLPLEQNIVINGGRQQLRLKLIKSNQPPVVEAHAERTPDRNGWYNKDVTVSFTAQDEDSQLTIDPPIQVTTEGANQVISGSATDSGGLTGTGNITLSIDKTAPVTEASVSGNVLKDNWYRSDSLVALTSNDQLSGVERTEYSNNQGSTWLPYSESIAIKEDGKHTLLFRSTDRAGNTEATKSVEVNIDKTLPTLKLKLNTYKLSPVNRKFRPIEVTVDSADNGSGIAAVELTSITITESKKAYIPKKNSSDIQNADYGTNDTSFKLLADVSKKNTSREYLITYTVSDQAGNTTTSSAIVTVTKSKQHNDDEDDDDDDDNDDEDDEENDDDDNED
ncbi:carboxypeptidase regulatory-like domain-containing protein [Paenibacillus sp. L3-i20]|uniref:carboxypeptidase regulatory-like domain-containing protein n=1 Tax=Paenibacillus sp. L3-i20 TaxID=2905833 RepID=UPI001EE0B080|nr:carboxypeptidase regulatory-like domain-containing protein [Paenibacillus sp. L3-i20]